MIFVDLNRAKELAHELRRSQRTKEFAPLDIKATIPSEAVEAEAKREQIRSKYTTMQETIDLVRNVDELRSVLKQNELLP